MEGSINFCDPNALKFTNAIVVVEEQEFHVLKGTLSNLSTKFKEIFEEQPEKSRVSVDFLTADQFQEILEIVYHVTDVTEDNAINILETAHQLGMPFIESKAIRVLSKLPETECSFQKRILLADRIQSDEMLDSVLSCLTTAGQVKQALPDNLKDLRQTTVLKLLQKMSAGVTEENTRPASSSNVRGNAELRGGPSMNRSRIYDPQGPGTDHQPIILQ